MNSNIKLGQQNLARVDRDKASDDKYKQIIIVRKDLQMSPGKLAVQVSHASMAFLTSMIRQQERRTHDGEGVNTDLYFDIDLYDGWINGIFTKVCLGVKNRNKLSQVIEDAENAGMVEGEDFFVIRDHCLTELEPEEFDENGEGWTTTCVGFKPMPSSKIDPVTRKLQLLR